MTNLTNSLQDNGVAMHLGASVLSWSVSRVLSKVYDGVKIMKENTMMKIIGHGILASIAVLLKGPASAECESRVRRMYSRRHARAHRVQFPSLSSMLSLTV